MEEIKILTQEHCGMCKTLKAYIAEHADQFEGLNIRYIKREDEPEEFVKLVKEFNVKATPTVIYKNNVLPSATPASFKVFLKMHKDA